MQREVTAGSHFSPLSPTQESALSLNGIQADENLARKQTWGLTPSRGVRLLIAGTVGGIVGRIFSEIASRNTSNPLFIATSGIANAVLYALDVFHQSGNISTLFSTLKRFKSGWHKLCYMSFQCLLTAAILNPALVGAGMPFGDIENQEQEAALSGETLNLEWEKWSSYTVEVILLFNTINGLIDLALDTIESLFDTDSHRVNRILDAADTDALLRAKVEEALKGKLGNVWMHDEAKGIYEAYCHNLLPLYESIGLKQTTLYDYLHRGFRGLICTGTGALALHLYAACAGNNLTAARTLTAESSFLENFTLLGPALAPDTNFIIGFPLFILMWKAAYKMLVTIGENAIETLIAAVNLCHQKGENHTQASEALSAKLKTTAIHLVVLAITGGSLFSIFDIQSRGTQNSQGIAAQLLHTFKGYENLSAIVVAGGVNGFQQLGLAEELKAWIARIRPLFSSECTPDPQEQHLHRKLLFKKALQQIPRVERFKWLDKLTATQEETRHLLSFAAPSRGERSAPTQLTALAVLSGLIEPEKKSQSTSETAELEV